MKRLSTDQVWAVVCVQADHLPPDWLFAKQIVERKLIGEKKNDGRAP